MSKRSGVTVKTLQLREAQLSILDMVIPLLWLCDVDCVYSTVAHSSVGDASLQSMTIDMTSSLCCVACPRRSGMCS